MLTREIILNALAHVQSPTGQDVVTENRISGLTIKDNNIGFILTAHAHEASALESQCQEALRPLQNIGRISIITTNPSHAASPAPNTPPASLAKPQPNVTTSRLGRWIRGKAESRESNHCQNDASQQSGEAPSTIQPRPLPSADRADNATTLPGVKRIIAIAAGKGGVGKSTLTVLLAHALAARGEHVAICDCDIHGPSIPRMLGLPLTQPVLENGQMIPPSAHGIAAHSIAFITGDSAAIMRGPMVTKSLRQLLFGTRWNAPFQENESTATKATSDHTVREGECLPQANRGSGETPSHVSASEPTITLLLDLPPGTGDTQLSLVQSLKIDAAILLTTPQDIAVIDAAKAGEMFRKVNVPLLGVVENMSGFTDPSGITHALFGAGGGQRLADHFGIPLLAQIALDPIIGQAMDKGQAVASSHHSMQVISGLVGRLMNI